MRDVRGPVATSSRDGHADRPFPICTKPCLSRASNAGRWSAPNDPLINSASLPSQIGPNESMVAHKWRFRGTDMYRRALAARPIFTTMSETAKAEESSNGTGDSRLEVTSPSVGSISADSSDNPSVFDELLVAIMCLHSNSKLDFELPRKRFAKGLHSHNPYFQDHPLFSPPILVTALAKEVPQIPALLLSRPIVTLCLFHPRRIPYSNERSKLPHPSPR